MMALHDLCPARIPGLALGIALLAGGPASAAGPVLGQKPGYTDKPLSAVPNAAAFGRRIWAPGLDDGYVPQGLTMAENKLLLSAYRSSATQPAVGPCRVFQVDPVSGETTGWFDLPADIGHTGGLAYGQGALFVADPPKLLRLDLARSLAQKRAVVTGRREVNSAMGPSFLAYADGALWFGAFLRAGEEGPRLYALPVARIFAAPPAPALEPADADRTLILPLLAQGATIDGQGRLWVTTSIQREGWLQQLDRGTGRVLARYRLPAGAEDLAHAGGDVLWSVSECGSRRWLASATFYPVLFEIFPERLSRAEEPADQRR